MKKLSGVFVIASAVFMISCQKDVSSKESDQEISSAITGNGAPSGPHYNLNIIGVKADHPKPLDFTGGNGRRIFVDLSGRTKILLKQGTFDVLDANGTDGNASFQLPEPDTNDDDITDYSVFIRGLGKPGGSASMITCFTDDVTQEEVCNTGNQIVNVTAHGNENKFQNVTAQLLYIWADLDGDGKVEKTPLFADPLDEYYWYYDNDGLKIAQLRFYPGVGTNVGTLQ